MHRRVCVLLWLVLVAVPAERAKADLIYSTAGNGTGLVTINPATGAATVVGGSGTTGSLAAAFGPDGTLFGIANFGSPNNRLVTYNLSSGAATNATSLPFGASNLVALEINNGGAIFGAGRSGVGEFYQVNPLTGTASLIADTGINNLEDLAFDSNGILWATNKTDLFTINPANGIATHVVALTGAGAADIGGIMFGYNNVLYGTSYVAGSSLFTINKTTGATTLVGSTGQSLLHGGDFARFSTPEPGGLTLIGIGVGCAAVAAWRRRRSAAPCA